MASLELPCMQQKGIAPVWPEHLKGKGADAGHQAALIAIHSVAACLPGRHSLRLAGPHAGLHMRVGAPADRTQSSCNLTRIIRDRLSYLGAVSSWAWRASGQQIGT